MARLKLTQPGFEALTGTLLGVRFVDGVSEDTSRDRIYTITAAIRGVLVDADGEEIEDPATALDMDLSEGRTRGAQPDTHVGSGSAYDSPTASAAALADAVDRIEALETAVADLTDRVAALETPDEPA